MPNQPPTSSLSRSPSTSRNETEFSRPSTPNTVEYASSDISVIVRNVMSTNVYSCSWLASFHHRRQRVMFSGVGSKT